MIEGAETLHTQISGSKKRNRKKALNRGSVSSQASAYEACESSYESSENPIDVDAPT